MDRQDLFKQSFVERSEVDIFNFIGAYAKAKGYDVLYFHAKRPSGTSFLETFEDGDVKFKFGTMHYIHILKEGELAVSIYYDNDDMGAIMGVPYYEVWDMNDIERFYEDELKELFDHTKELL